MGFMRYATAGNWRVWWILNTEKLPAINAEGRSGKGIIRERRMSRAGVRWPTTEINSRSHFCVFCRKPWHHRKTVYWFAFGPDGLIQWKLIRYDTSARWAEHWAISPGQPNGEDIIRLEKDNILRLQVMRVDYFYQLRILLLLLLFFVPLSLTLSPSHFLSALKLCVSRIYKREIDFHFFLSLPLFGKEIFLWCFRKHFSKVFWMFYYGRFHGD